VFAFRLSGRRSFNGYLCIKAVTMKAIVSIGALSMLLGGIDAACADDRPLTLEDAVNVATTAAPQLLSRRAAIEGAQSFAKSAGRLPDPALVAGVDNVPTNGAAAWSLEQDFMTMRKLGVMQSFPNRHKRRAEQDAAQAMVAVAESEAAQTQLELSQSVAQAWIARYAAELAQKSLLQLRPQLALQVELTRAAVASGRGTVSDALSAQATAAELNDRLLTARQELSTASAELARWIGTVAERPLAPPPSFAVLDASDTALLSSLHHHAALRAYDARIAAAKGEVAVADAAKRPDWSTELDYARRGPGYSDMVSVQFQVALPLFQSTRQEPAVNAKRASVRQLEADREAELRMHTAEISAMLAEWQSAKDRVALYEHERLPLARQRSELALAGLQAGQAEVRQTLTVLNEQIDIERSYIELIKSLGRSWGYLHYLPTSGANP
jgi:outer membrane protein, heavy metal efflux system